MPGHIRQSACEFHASGGILGIKRVRVFDVYICIEQLVWILFGIGSGRFGTAEVNCMLVARKDLPAAYHLAVVVDDAYQGVTLVTRGEDLLPATHVQRLLHYRYFRK